MHRNILDNMNIPSSIVQIKTDATSLSIYYRFLFCLLRSFLVSALVVSVDCMACFFVILVATAAKGSSGHGCFG